MTYTVVGLLGRGGMAVVELAVDDQGRHLARKRVALDGSARHIALARHRIRREAEILASLDHPGIVPLLAVEDDGADVVLVMPRMMGSLADRVETCGPLPPAEVLAIAYALLDALATAHRQGVVHRDIKPANVLFDRAGRPALADFGVAVTRQFTPGLTMAGAIVGTPEFIAPEQAAGKPATAASDIFSLGATLTYALTGRGPYGEGEPLALINRAAQGEIEPLPQGVPEQLRLTLAALLAPRPERRPTAAAASGGPNGTSVDYSPRPEGTRGKRGKRVALMAIILATLLAAAATGLARYQTGRATTAALSAPPVPAAPAPSTTTCTPLLYQPCGQSTPAPGTDGNNCVAGRADFDRILANGCEAVSDYQPGQALHVGQPVQANLVPETAIDTFQAAVTQSLFNFCLTKFRVTLTAPPGTTDRVDVVRDGKVLASATSTNGEPATARASKPSCFDSGTRAVTVEVSAVSGQSAEDFRLVSAGSW
ncbi:MAG: serine/threonine protein kinase [Actinomycetota bacterium]|nr:serine/threonine protein kinase [Actinomycetota bacterium]